MGLRSLILAALGGVPKQADASALTPLTRDASDYFGYGKITTDERYALASVDELVGRKGLSIYREMQADADVASCLEMIRVAVLASPLEITPASSEEADEEMAEFLREDLDYLQDQTIDDVITAILDGLGMGVSAQEKVGRVARDGMLGTAYFQPVLRESFTIHVDQYGRVSPDGVWQARGNVTQIGEAPENYDHYPRDRFVIWSFRRMYNNQLGWSILRPAYRAWEGKRFLDQEWLRYMQLHAIPNMIGTVPQGTTATVQERILAQMKNLQMSRRAVFEQGVSVTFEGHTGAAANANFKEAFEAKRSEIKAALMNPSLMMETASSGPAGSSSKQEDTFLRFIRALQRSIAATLRKQWAEPLISANWGDDAACPMVAFKETDAATILAEVEKIERAVKLGLSIGESYMREVTSIPEPKEGEPLLEAPAAPSVAMPDSPADEPVDVEDPEEAIA